MEKTTIIFISFVTVLLLFFSMATPSVNSKLLLENKKETKTQNKIHQEINNKQTDKKNTNITLILSKIKDNENFNSNMIQTASLGIFAILIASVLYNIGILDIVLAGVFGFLFGLATWMILGPFCVILSPIFGMDIAIDTGSILAGVFSTILLAIGGVTFPLSFALLCTEAIFSIAIDPGPIWM